jgi:ribosomal protein S18 acetylase RimI-like enzyme
MISIKKLSQNQKEIQFSKDLYEQSFPIEERRDFSLVLDIYKTDLLSLNLIYDNEIMVGILNIWDFNEFCYIEHLAVSEQYRNRKIASKVLEQLNAQNKLIILEVELPTDELSRRRIGFYQRNSFSIQPFTYFQPPYRKGEERIKMHLMANTQMPINKTKYDEVVGVIEKKVYEKFW